jgi:hypothetical protein
VPRRKTLSERRGLTGKPALVDGVPPWLVQPLHDWLAVALTPANADALALQLRLDLRDQRDRFGNVLPVRGLLARCRESDDTFLNIVDAALALASD